MIKLFHYHLSLSEIKRLCNQAEADVDTRQQLINAAFSADTRTATNALWAFTHFDDDHIALLADIRPQLIHLAMTAKLPALRRLPLNIILRLPQVDDETDVEFINFCIARITSATEPYAIRALCMKLAFKLCRHYPDLLNELNLTLDSLDSEPPSPGLYSALRQMRKAISKITKQKK